MWGFHLAMEKTDRDIKGFLYPRMYHHDRVIRVMDDAERVVHELFAHYMATTKDLPAEWGEGIDATRCGRRVPSASATTLQG